MGSPIVNRSFARLFKKYRLRSEIETLTEFGDLLAEEGFVFDNSIFTHWQKGTRVPNNRRIILTMIRIFFKKHAISTQEEINEILAALGMRDLTLQELVQFTGISPKPTPFTVPEEIEFFVGRDLLVKKISSYLLKNYSVYLYGQAGSGKSSLCIHIAHNLRNHFSDGILWYRYDIKHKEDILLDIGKEFNLDLSKEITLENKAKYIRELLIKKDILLILDNVDTYEELLLLFGDKKFPCLTMITSRLVPSKYFENSKGVAVNGFNVYELQEYARLILGNAFYLSNINKINELGKVVEFSPLLLSVLFKQIEQKPNNIDYYLQKLDTFPFESVYDRKTIESSLNLSFDALSFDIQEIFVSLAIFHGSDFSANIVSYINEKSLKITNTALAELQQHSLLELSVEHRYRLHPLIKLYLQNKINEKKYTKRLADYCLLFLGRDGSGEESRNIFLNQEADNIIGLISLCKKYGLDNEINTLWNYIGVFFWDTGRWNKLDQYGVIVEQYSRNYKNYILLFTYFIFTILTIWWFYIYFYRQHDVFIRSLFSCTYTIIAIWGGIIGLLIAKKWNVSKSLIGSSINMFSIGLLFQSFGQIAYGYLMLYYAPNQFMYPSFGDIGYFGSIFFYVYGAILILRVAKAKNRLISFRQKFIAITIPVLLLTISYIFFLNGYKPDWTHPITLFFDFAYPLGQTVYLYIALLAFMYSRTLSTGLMKKRVSLIIFALLIQYLADYIFLFSVKDNVTKPGDFVDYLYLFAYFLMTIAVLQFLTIQESSKFDIVFRFKRWFQVN